MGELKNEATAVRAKPSSYVTQAGTEVWTLYGSYHRLDGPAILFNHGIEMWYVHGKRCKTQKEYQESANLTNEEVLALVIKYGDIAL